jgi:hypothetical protein
MGIKWKGELEYGTSGNYEDEDDSSLWLLFKDSGISKSTDNEEVDKDVIDMSDAELDENCKRKERDSRSGWWFTW